MDLGGETWRVVRGDEVCGEITIDGVDMPWVRGSFVAGPGFAGVKPLFDRELELLERLDEDPEAWEAAYDRVADAVRLVSPRGPVADFLLHVRDGRAWFRWDDEPLT
ncbi:hypothetical protein [Bailinhaonella thermotolerans]|uniref:Uncharacterized protein n=1 Tax=Bailinhaonella thermotolerans TaxID=1070861 RepID=A0A3A4B2L5_9ACTN|nr:hypothetical protein [Bailinhaonella thermotolerans]RJL35965.1 hypothetical protein D5H75_04145 [Bailinhaonella thermotolerans]